MLVLKYSKQADPQWMLKDLLKRRKKEKQEHIYRERLCACFLYIGEHSEANHPGKKDRNHAHTGWGISNGTTNSQTLQQKVKLFLNTDLHPNTCHVSNRSKQKKKNTRYLKCRLEVGTEEQNKQNSAEAMIRMASWEGIMNIYIITNLVLKQHGVTFQLEFTEWKNKISKCMFTSQGR